MYIRPKIGGPWLKFDDELVTVVKKEEALDDNFGAGVGQVS